MQGRFGLNRNLHEANRIRLQVIERNRQLRDAGEKLPNLNGEKLPNLNKEKVSISINRLTGQYSHGYSGEGVAIRDPYMRAMGRIVQIRNRAIQTIRRFYPDILDNPEYRKTSLNAIFDCAEPNALAKTPLLMRPFMVTVTGQRTNIWGPCGNCTITGLGSLFAGHRGDEWFPWISHIFGFSPIVDNLLG